MVWTIPTIAFVVGMSVELVNLTAFVASAAGYSNYWPPGERDWRYYAHWTLEQVFNVAMLAVAAATWNDLGLPLSIVAAGGAVFLVTFTGALMAGRDLGTEETMGLEGELRTGGWYRYSRNPQYVCYIGATLGFAVLAASPLVTAMCVPYLLQWVVLPFAEESWLRDQYGEAYERYAERVPRFAGVRSLRAFADTQANDPERLR